MSRNNTPAKRASKLRARIASYERFKANHPDEWAAWQALKMRCGEAQNWRCCHCGKLVEPNWASLEHVIPRSCGGPHDWLNCAMSCRPCNWTRGNNRCAEAEAIVREMLREKRMAAE